MKAYLLHEARDFAWQCEPIWNEATLVQDLELRTLYRAMASGDEYLYDVVRRVVPVSLQDPREILYRQAVLEDCCDHEAIVRDLYAITVEAMEVERKSFYWALSGSASSVLHAARDHVQALVPVLRRLRDFADLRAGGFRSAGFRRLCAMIHAELPEEYFDTIKQCLKQLQFHGGVLISAQLARGNKGAHHVLRKPHERDANLLRRLLAKRPPCRTFRIAERDENGARALSELEARGIDPVANALAQSVDHIKSFFSMLRLELGFYLACVNLRNDLRGRGLPVSLPVCHAAS
jgi:hypothetical protein